QAARPAGELLQIFLEAAGIDPEDLHPSTDPAQVLENAGRLLNEFVAGISEMLAARSNVKNMFRLDQTTVLPRNNNPLKLSAGAVDSLRQLLVGREGEYLGGLDSVREACRDLRYHHDALIGAMIRACDDYFQRFDPDELESNFRQSMSRKPLFEALAQRKYWEFYRDLYPVMMEKSSAALPVQYTEDFVRYYERQLNDFKRREIALGDTQKLDRGSYVESHAAATADSREAPAGYEPTECVKVLPMHRDPERKTG
ncbi:MAG: type VI secretion system-associated FHA domain protein TagH, partial [Woeseiaceae bacterium]|nr:type VI secretion system-associated FHA domain protein TagH [Woeseiaceae bacterium]